MLRGVLWNLYLAAVPVVLGYLLAWVAGRKPRGGAARLGVAALGLLWLAFLPNTCYLLTEWRHLLLSDRLDYLREASLSEPRTLVRAAKWVGFFLAYSGAGVFAFVFAIRPVERALRSMGVPFLAVAPPFFFSMALGVYLGLVVRLNTWDLVVRPGEVWAAARAALLSTPHLAVIAAFGVFLWVLYEAVDLWLDALAERLRRRGSGRRSRRA